MERKTTPNPRQWILNRLKTLDESQTIMVNIGQYIHSVFEHVQQGWVFGMDELHYQQVTDENLQNSFKPFEGSDFTCTIFNSKEQLAHEVRNYILMNCVDTLMKSGGTFPEIISEVKENLGTVVEIRHGLCGILTGLCVTLEDYYYVVVDSHENLHMISCVGCLKYMDNRDDDDIPDEVLKLRNDISKLKWTMYSKTCTTLNPKSFEVHLISI